MTDNRTDEQDFRAWLRTLDRLPAEVPGNETWNAAVIMDTIEKINQPTDPRSAR